MPAQNNNHWSEDEALARALQMQYEREAAAAAAAAASGEPPRSSAWTRTTPTATATATATSLRDQRATTSSLSRRRPPSCATSDDEALARRLAAEEEAAQAAAAIAAASARSNSRGRGGDGNSTNNNNGQPNERSGYVFADSAAVPTTQRASGGYVFPAPERRPSPTTSAMDHCDFSSATSPTAMDENNLFDDPSVLESMDMLRQQEEHDREMARRVEQELQDELVAERLQQKEQERVDRQMAAAVISTTSTRNKRKLCGSLFTIALVVGAVIAIVYYFVVLGGGVPKLNLTPEDFAREDPFNELDPDEAYSWPNNGKGVRLTIINALETRWYQFFYDAVDDWDDGHPDALALDTEFSSQPGNAGHDVACKAVNGKVKVCNGNYGNTRWKGINEVLIDGRRNIIASAARMNEFYLSGQSDDDHQYTMCHELGHAWGLGHTDETFGNPDLGDCMDYTNNPKNNKQPTERNFVFLWRMYGLYPGSMPYSPPTPAPTREPSTIATQASVVGGEGGDGGTRKLSQTYSPSPEASQSFSSYFSPLRNTVGSSTTRDHTGDYHHHHKISTWAPNQPLPQWLADAMEGAFENRHAGRRLVNSIRYQWRVLHQHAKGEAHAVDLPNGFQLRVHYLWADAGAEGIEDGTKDEQQP